MKLRILVFFLVIISCTNEKKTVKSNLSYFPLNATAIVKINNPDAFTRELKNNSFLEEVLPTSLFSSFLTKTDALDVKKFGEHATMAFYPVGRDNQEFVLLQSLDSIPLNVNDSNIEKTETLTYENKQITKYVVNGNEFYGTILNQKNILSSSQLLLENAIRVNGKNPVPKALQKLVRTADPTKSASFFFNLQNGSLPVSTLKTKNEANIGLFADWISVDFSAKQNEMLLSGVAIAHDSTGRFINLFKGTTPLSDRTANLAPQNADAVLSFSFNDYDQFLRNQTSFLDIVASTNNEIKNIEEIGVIFLNDEKVIAIHAIDNEGILEYLERLKTGSVTYQGSEIWRLQDPQFLDQHFQPLVKNFECNFYTVFENTHVFAGSQGILQTIIANRQSGFTFDGARVYETLKKQIGSESSMLFISGTQGMNYFLNKHFKPTPAQEIKNKKLNDLGFAIQLTNDDDFSHFNVFVANIKKAPTNNAVAPIYNLELDNDLVTSPQYVKNHRNHNYEIVVQDQDNHLYLISTEGKVLWKKQLEGRVQGKIHQVDLYKNGKLQLAFCTNSQFLVLDRNGEEVPPFNKKYEGGNLNGLAVFDYEKNRDYRFVVTQGRKVFMYNSKGNIVSGFTYTETESPVISPPRHFKINKKDYLVFQLENGQLKIRHRAGGDRIKVDRTIAFSSNETFFYKNKFSVTDKKGVLHQVDLKGKLSATNFNLGKDHGMFATSKTLALMDDNTLNIKGKKVDLAFGVYTQPKIFYINDKIYVTVTDIQNQKIYLYDSQAKPIPNFPVFGTSMIDLLDMDNDNKLELVAKDQENSIIVYAIH
ncbi:MAG: ribonuclease HII [Bacteroidota bacterium]